jgi:hypothetical protein
MKPQEVVRKELVALLRGGNAHMDFEEAIADFPPDRVGEKAPNTPYSCWHLLEHMRIAQWDIVEFILDPGHVSPSWPEGYRPDPAEAADFPKWERSVEGFRREMERMVGIVQDPGVDPLAPLPHAREYTVFREALTLADHNANHIGEIAILRQVLGLWPENTCYLG